MDGGAPTNAWEDLDGKMNWLSYSMARYEQITMKEKGRPSALLLFGYHSELEGGWSDYMVWYLLPQ